MRGDKKLRQSNITRLLHRLLNFYELLLLPYLAFAMLQLNISTGLVVMSVALPLLLGVVRFAMLCWVPRHSG